MKRRITWQGQCKGLLMKRLHCVMRRAAKACAFTLALALVFGLAGCATTQTSDGPAASAASAVARALGEKAKVNDSTDDTLIAKPAP